MHIPITLSREEQNETKTVETPALVDCGAGGVFMDQNYARSQNFPLKQLPFPINVHNVDGSPNKKGKIRYSTTAPLTVLGRTRRTRFLITGLGSQQIILGLPWLRKENPDINWELKTMKWRKRAPLFRRKKENPSETKNPRTTMEEEPSEAFASTMNVLPEPSKAVLEEIETDDDLLVSFIHGEEMEDVWIRAKTTTSQTLAQENASEEKKLSLEEMIPPEYHDFLDLFDKEAASRFPESRPWDHPITLKEGFVPRRAKNYNLAPRETEATKTFIAENKEKGYIRESTSPQASGFFFVSKKNGELRPCQDYRYLNEWTVKNAYPLPLISDLLDQLKGAKYFTKLDIRWGYNNVRIKDGDQWKAAFITPEGLFEPTVMFFGLCNSPATFQSMMDSIFQDLKDKGYVIVYMDDILIFANTKEDLRKATREVLARLRENDLYLKGEKCEFEKTKVDYLGMVVEQGKLAMDPVKVKGIREWPAPTTVKQVRSFLGFGNFYRKFIRGYSELAGPLNGLLKKDQPFRWTQECQNSFDTLKRRFTEAPVLIMPDTSKPFQVEADASLYASGAVLTQLDSNGNRHPVAFISKTFSPTERLYKIYDRELLAIMRALREWRHYLNGSPHRTIVYSDHQNLTYFKDPRKLNPRQRRWIPEMEEYYLKLVHMPGARMTQADALSRRSDHCPDPAEENEEITLLPENLFANLLELDRNGLLVDKELQEEILNSDKWDQEAVDALRLLKEDKGTKDHHSFEHWTVEDVEGQELMLYKDRIYVPDNAELRRKIVHRYHDTEAAGHPGMLGTLELLRRDYYWPGMTNFVKEYVKGCAVCQQYKINRRPTNPPLNPIAAPESTRPFSQCSMDLITDLPVSNGYDSIFVFVDHGLTKGVVLTPCHKTITADGIADILFDKILVRYGRPDSIISDRGPQFVSKAFQDCLDRLGVKSKLSTAYHPQSDGGTERVNQEIQAYLSMFCTLQPEKWSELLGMVEFTHNSRTHAGRKQSPFELLYGYQPPLLPLASGESRFPAVEERLKNLELARNEALAAHELARARMAERSKQGFKPFQKGQKVWLEAKNLRLPYATRKIAPKREGPFVIADVLGPLTYRLKLPDSWKIHDVFHAALLTPFTETDIHGPAFTRPPPELNEDGEDQEWEIEGILKHREDADGNREFLIKWRGYPDSENSWEPEDNLENAKEAKESYLERVAKKKPSRARGKKRPLTRRK